MELICKPFLKILDFQALFHYKKAIRFIFVNRSTTNSLGALIMMKLLPGCVVWEMFLSQQNICCNFIQPKLCIFVFSQISPRPCAKSSPSSASPAKRSLLPLPTGPTLLLAPEQVQHCRFRGGWERWKVLWMWALSSLGAPGGTLSAQGAAVGSCWVCGVTAWVCGYLITSYSALMQIDKSLFRDKQESQIYFT